MYLPNKNSRPDKNRPLQADWLLRISSALSLFAACFIAFAMMGLYSAQEKNSHYLVKVQDTVGLQLVAVSTRSECMPLRSADKQDRFVVAQLRDANLLLYIAEISYLQTSKTPSPKQPAVTCRSLAENNYADHREASISYTPCQATNQNTNCLKNLSLEGSITSQALSIQAKTLAMFAMFFWVLSVLVFYFSDKKSVGRFSPSDESFLYARQIFTVVLALSGILFARFVITLNAATVNPGFADKLTVVGVEFVIVPVLVGLLLKENRVAFKHLACLFLFAVAWLYILTRDPLVSEYLMYRFTQLIDSPKSNVLSLAKTSLLLLAELLIVVALFVCALKPWRASLARLGGTISWLPAHIPYLLIAFCLLSASVIALVGGGDSAESPLKRLPYLSLIVVFFVGAVSALTTSCIERKVWILLGLFCLTILALGLIVGDRGTSLVALFASTLAASVVLASLPSQRPWLQKVQRYGKFFLLFIILIPIGMKCYVSSTVAAGLNQDSKIQADYVFNIWAQQASNSALKNILRICSVPEKMSEMTAEKTQEIDACFARNYAPSNNFKDMHEGADGLSWRVRIYAWLYGQPLRGVWTQTALENISGYVQGLSNSLPESGFSMFFGDGELPKVTEFQRRNSRDGLDYEWLSGIWLLRPFGLCAAVLVLGCYLMLYQSLGAGNNRIQAKLAVATFSFITTWGLLQTQGVFPFTGFSTPLLTPTSFARDWLPNFTALVGVLFVSFTKRAVP
jgi:hypothetical protein